jgi:nucleoside-diphosphate-sugar epimerase
MERPGTTGEVINLGNPEEHTILEFASIISEIAGRPAGRDRFVEPAVGDDPQRRKPDTAKARHLLGWEPRVELWEGLTRTVHAIRAELGLPELAGAAR